MQNHDVEIIRQRLARSTEQSHSINNTVTIDGVEYTFAPRDFAYGFSMTAPEAFEIMPKEMAKKKFPYEDRPEIILSNADYRVCIAFTCAELQNESLESRLRSYMAYTKRLNPTAVFFTHGIYDLPDGPRIAHYDDRYPAADGDMYNITVFADLPDAELFGWLLCPAGVQTQWEPLMRQMVQTITLGKDEQECH